MSTFPPFGNLYCPPWMGFSPVLQGIRDEDYDLDLQPVDVPAGDFANQNFLQVDTDGDLLVREFQFVITAFAGEVAPTPADIRVRIRDGDGKLLTSDFMPIADLNGPIVPPWPLRRGSVPIIDYQNTGGSDATVWMLLKTWKRRLCPGDPLQIPSNYTPMYKRYLQNSPTADFDDFEYPFEFEATGATDLLKQPLQTDNDADFLWRGITGDWNCANNDVAAVGSVALTFYDVGGLPLNLYPLINPWGSGNAGQFRELTLASGGARPAVFFPEIFIPRGGIVSVDLSFGGAATVRFSLRGVKVYGKCPGS